MTEHNEIHQLAHYRCRHFELRELVDPGTFKALGERCWQLFDPRLLRTLDALRDLWGPTVINTWHTGGQFRFRGYRPPTESTGARYSQHRCGRGADMHFLEADVPRVRAHILERQDLPEYRGITCVELDVTWLHIDCRNHDKAGLGILQVRP